MYPLVSLLISSCILLLCRIVFLISIVIYNRNAADVGSGRNKKVAPSGGVDLAFSGCKSKYIIFRLVIITVIKLQTNSYM